jgi:hypothetical protein
MRGLERNVSRPAPAGRAARAHQAVADEEPNRARRRRGGDEVIDRVGKKRHLVAAVLQQLVRIAIAPVFVERGPEPQVLDADAASIEKVGETAGLRQPGPAPRTRRSRLFSARRPSGENPGTRRAESKTRPAIPLCSRGPTWSRPGCLRPRGRPMTGFHVVARVGSLLPMPHCVPNLCRSSEAIRHNRG